MKKPLLLLLLAGALLAVPAAGAHVTVNPNTVPVDSFSRFAVRVPNETADVDTTKIVLKLPEELSFVSFQPKPGWTRSVTTVKLAKPVTNDEGETVTERIGTVTWEGGKVAPGEFDEFGISAKVPDEETTLVFPATQTYSNGDVVRWIGAPDSDTPAPRVTLTAKVEAAPTPAPTPAAAETEDDDSVDWLAIALGAAGLVAGLTALAITLTRRPRSS
jgi:periplasmic copper chaperone A